MARSTTLQRPARNRHMFRYIKRASQTMSTAHLYRKKSLHASTRLPSPIHESIDARMHEAFMLAIGLHAGVAILLRGNGSCTLS